MSIADLDEVFARAKKIAASGRPVCCCFKCQKCFYYLQNGFCFCLSN